MCSESWRNKPAEQGTRPETKRSTRKKKNSERETVIRMEQRILQLEAALADRDEHIRQVVEAASAAAVAAEGPPQAVNPAAQQAAHQAAQAAHQAAIQEKRYNTAARALASTPKFYGTESWRNFESAYLTWYRINRIQDLDADFQKRSLLTCMRGKAIEMTRPKAENTAAWHDAADLNAYVVTMRGVFLPPEESEMSRTEFKIRRQSRKEDVSTYLSAKIALWQMAYADAERSFTTLMDETIKGLENRVVKRQLRYAIVRNEEELRRTAVRLVAAERQCYMEGTSESTSLDGLAATTKVQDQQQNNDEMEWEENVQGMRNFDGRCNLCKAYGHKAKDCRKKKNTENQRSETRKCYTCDRTGHLKKDCRAKTKANGEKIIRKQEDKDKKKKDQKKGRVRKQNEVTDEESDGDNEDFLEEKEESEEEG